MYKTIFAEKSLRQTEQIHTSSCDLSRGHQVFVRMNYFIEGIGN